VILKQAESFTRSATTRKAMRNNASPLSLYNIHLHEDMSDCVQSNHPFSPHPCFGPPQTAQENPPQSNNNNRPSSYLTNGLVSKKTRSPFK